MLREEIDMIVTHRQREVRKRRQEVARDELPGAIAEMGRAVARYQILKSWLTTASPAHIGAMLELRGALAGPSEQQALALIETHNLEEIPHA